MSYIPQHDALAITAEASALLAHLHAGGSWGYWWTLPGKASSWWPTGSPATVPAGEGINVYFGVHPAGRAKGTGERATIGDIAAVNCLFAEFDAKDYGEKAGALAQLQGLALPPSVIVDSGGGYHAYWLLDRPFVFADQADRERARQLQAAWVAHVGGDKGAKDLARVLRLPGTRNYKPAYGPDFPMVAILRADYGRVYALGQLEGAARPAADGLRANIPAHTGGAALEGDAGDYWLDKALAGARIGNRNATGFWLACQLRDNGLDEREAEAIVRRYAGRVPTDPQNAYSEGDALASLRQAYKGARRDPAQSAAKRNGERRPAADSLRANMGPEAQPPGWLEEAAGDGQPPAERAAAGRLKWGGRRGDRAAMRRGNIKYTVVAEDHTLAIRVTGGQGHDRVDVTLDRETPDLDGAAAAIANGLAMPAEEARQDLAAIPGELARHPLPAEVPAPVDAERLAHFAPWVNGLLAERSGRAVKVTVAEAIRKWLLARGRLLCDAATERPYMLGDDRRALPLDDDGIALQATLAAAGMNPTEASFEWLLADLRIAAYRDGRQIRLARWTMAEGGTIYLSCGPLAYVVAQPAAPLELRDNGAEGIVFAADACLPAWRFDARPVDPFGLPAFNPALITPPEAFEYAPAVQQRLLAAWLCAMISGIRPLPILAAIGDKGGGKSTMARAILRLALGQDADLGPLNADPRDLMAMTVGRPLVGLDNVDSTEAAALWLPDALAVVATGGRWQGREYYTKAGISDLPIQAALILTSRTATFARADVAERILPIITAELMDDGRRADSALAQDLASCRDGALVYLAQTAANVLSWRAQAPRGLPARFLDFAEVVWSYCQATGQAAEAVPTLLAWRAAQTLAVGEANPLLAAIVECGARVPEEDRTNVSPSYLIKALGQAGAEVPYLGGGKAILRELRELSASLRLAGWVLTIDAGDEKTHTYVTLRQAR